MLLEDIIITLTPVVLSVVGTAIYMNRRRINKLYQRLFGMSEDDTDRGYIVRINNTIQEINKENKVMRKEMEEQHQELMNEFYDNKEQIEKIKEEINGDKL